LPGGWKERNLRGKSTKSNEGIIKKGHERLDDRITRRGVFLGERGGRHEGKERTIDKRSNQRGENAGKNRQKCSPLRPVNLQTIRKKPREEATQKNQIMVRKTGNEHDYLKREKRPVIKKGETRNR